MKPRLINALEAALYLGVCENTFRAYVRLGKLPRPIRLGKRRVYDLKKIDLALDKLSGIGTKHGIIDTAEDKRREIHELLSQD